MDFNISGKVALVCGSGSGLGRAIAQSLAAEGVIVAVTGRTPEKLEETVELIHQQGGQAYAYPLDLNKPETFVDVLCEIRAAIGPIAILVNNSGGPPPSAITSVSKQTWDLQFSSMVSSLIELTNQVLPDMQATGWGRIITSTSSGVEAPITNLGISNSLRMALLGWSKTLANEVASEGITSNILIPGRIATDRVGQLDAAKASREGSDVITVMKNSIATIPVGRYGHPEEYAAVAAFLASAQASFITGSVLRVDGGMISAI